MNGATIGGDGIRRDDSYNSYNIVLAEGTTNRVTSVTGSALACGYGSIVISGAGSLNATGAANGIWADCAVTITDGANVTATGLNGCGVFSDSFFDTVGITNGATAILSGSTYGIGGYAYVEIDNASATDPVKCSVCEYEITPALGHTHKNLTKVPAETADCEKDGNIEYYTCTCGKWFADATASVEITDKDGVVIKGGHKYGTDWKSDKNNHWNECACGDKGNTTAHKDENTDGKCDVCDYNVGLPTTPDGGNKPSDTPQTGDNTQLGLWIALLIVSSFGIVAITLFGKKKYSVR